MSKLVILQTVVPDYRRKLFAHILSTLGQNNFKLFAGQLYFEKTVKTDPKIQFINRVRNYYLFNRKLLFQIGMWHQVLKKNTLILELNPRIISNWIILIIRRIFLKKTILWGHAWPRKGKSNATDFIRNLMRKLASGILVYTNTQKDELQTLMPTKKIFCAPNSLLYQDEMTTQTEMHLINNVIYVGRLTESKKPLVLLRSFHKVITKLPSNTKLVIVGDGDQRKVLHKYAEDNNIQERVNLLGHIGDYERLKALYNESLVSVSPGYIGLSVTQSFGFGVPMLVSLNENHSPEIEAVKQDFNAMYFETDNIDDLSDKIMHIYNHKEVWVNKRTAILDYCKNNYSIQTMAKSFLSFKEW